MTVNCFIEQKDGTRHTFEAGCFGWMDVSCGDLLITRAKGSDYTESGAKVGYVVKYKDCEEANKYIKYLKNAGLLVGVDIKTQESNKGLEAVCSNELPGQEIVGKFELLRHLEGNYYKTLVELAEELEKFNAGNRDRYNLLVNLLHKHSTIIVAMYITKWFVVEGATSRLPDCIPDLPSKIFLDLASNCIRSRKVYKGWKDSSYFSGVYRYFSDATKQEMSASEHHRNPEMFKNKDDIKHTYVGRSAAIHLSVKEAVLVFERNCAELTRY